MNKFSLIFVKDSCQLHEYLSFIDKLRKFFFFNNTEVKAYKLHSNNITDFDRCYLSELRFSY